MIKDTLTKLAVEINPVNGGEETIDPGAANSKLTSILNSVIGSLGIVAVIVIVIGGILYMTSSGDACMVNNVTVTILYGIIGLVICALAYAIVNFVISNLN